MRTARSTHGRRRAPNARHAAPRSTLRRIVTALVVVVSLLTVTGTASALVAYYKLNGNITKDDVSGLLGNDRPKKVENPDTSTEPENILLIGSDKRLPSQVNSTNAG